MDMEGSKEMSEETPRPIMLYVEGGMFIGKEMVFCKDCKYWTEVKTESFCDGTKYREDCTTECTQWNISPTADDFCSRGEKK